MVTPDDKRLKKLLLGIAVGFVMLGGGNIAFGTYKLREYSFLLSEASNELTIPKLDTEELSSPILERYASLDGQSEHIRHVQARVQFYEFVILGGKCLLALAGVALLASLLAGEKEGVAQAG